MFRKLIPTLALTTAAFAVCFLSADQANADCPYGGRGVSVGFSSFNSGFGGGGFNSFGGGFNNFGGGFGRSYYRPSYGGFNSFNSFGGGFGGGGFNRSFRPSYGFGGGFGRSSCGRY